MYLGDGCLSAHPRGVFKLRISMDARYPAIAAECERAVRSVMPYNRVGKVGYGTWQELFAYSKSWPCLFPQHGPGRTHPRYAFANLSEGIRTIFCEACDLMGLHWTTSGEKTIYVSRKADVAVLDRFIGPKR